MPSSAPISSLPAASAVKPRRQLTLLDTTCIIVGIIIGAGIFETTPHVAANVNGTIDLWLVWLAGGFVALIGSLCYAELATTYPEDGGDYVFLTRAYGRNMGFLFGWAEYWIVRPGNIGAMAYIFARYAYQLLPLGSDHDFRIYACVAIILLTGLNLCGVRSGKWTQNTLTLAKVIGLLGVVAVGLFLVTGPTTGPSAARPPDSGSLQLALIMVLFTYGGWSEMAYVSAEIRDPSRNVLRALLLGSGTVTLIYLLTNISFVNALGLPGVRASEAVAADVVSGQFTGWGERAISLLICISCLGTINGMIFTGSRIFYKVGTEHRCFHWLGRWDERFDAPTRSLVLQAAVTLALVIGFGPNRDAFKRLVVFTTPVFWFFFLAVGVSLFVLRFRDAGAARPFRVTFYPLTPILFCASCLFMLYASLNWAYQNGSHEVLWSLLILASGLGICLTRRSPVAPTAGAGICGNESSRLEQLTKIRVCETVATLARAWVHRRTNINNHRLATVATSKKTSCASRQAYWSSPALRADSPRGRVKRNSWS